MATLHMLYPSKHSFDNISSQKYLLYVGFTIFPLSACTHFLDICFQFIAKNKVKKKNITLNEEKFICSLMKYKIWTGYAKEIWRTKNKIKKIINGFPDKNRNHSEMTLWDKVHHSAFCVVHFMWWIVSVYNREKF